MRAFLCFTAFYLLFSLSNLVAQSDYRVLFDTSDVSIPGLEIRDAIQAIDGFIYIVGSQQSNNGDLNGILLRMDSLGGVQLVKTYGAGKNDQLRAIVQLPSGHLLLAGGSASSSLSGLMEAWWMKVDYQGKIISEKRLAHQIDRSITHLAISENGKLMAAGEDGVLGSGKLWIGSLNLNKGTCTPISVGNERYLDVVSLNALSQDRFMICGNYKLKSGRDPSAWYAISTASGQIDEEGSFGQRKKTESIKQGSQSLVDGTVNLIGESSRQDLEGDPMIIKLDENGKVLRDTVYSRRDIDWAKGILATLEGDQLLLVRSNSPKGYQNKLIVLGGKHEVMLKEKREFYVAKMLLTIFNQWIAIGTWQDRKQTGLWRMGLAASWNGQKSAEAQVGWAAKNDQANSSSQSGGLECSIAKFEDGDDKILTPGEDGSLRFSIKNNNTSPVIGIRVETQAANQVAGLSFDAVVFVPVIPPGQSKNVDIPLRTTSSLQAGKSIFNIKITINNQVLCNTSGSISSVLNSQRKSSHLTLIEPDPTRNPRLNVRTDEERARIVVQGVSPSSTNNTSKTLIKNGAKVEDIKNILISSNFTQIGDDFITNYTIDVPLDTGRNEIRLEIGEGDEKVVSPTMVFYRTHRKPTLHVLAIAPVYQNLKYNGKDATDFSKMMQQQLQSGIYDTVIVHTLTSKEETSKENIEREFNIFNKNASSDYKGLDQIDQEDVWVIFYSGHGIIYNDDFRILPSGYVSGLGLEASTTLNFKYLLNDYVRTVKCKILILIDACHSGGAKDEGELSSILTQLLEAAPGNLILASSSATESSYENEKWENGAYTEAILEALRNEEKPTKDNQTRRADSDGNGFLSPAELSDYVIKRVGKLTQEINHAQNPKVTIQGLNVNLPLFRVAK